MPDGNAPYQMRNPCPKCGCAAGYIKQAGAQDVVRCLKCDHFCYNAPRVETGKAVRTVQTVHAAIKPKLRAKILDRANGRCERCGKGPESGCAMHVGHLISVSYGLANGFTEIELNDAENLFCACDECNLGAGHESESPRFYMALLRARLLRGNA
jgi:5-methylcytosine-specific restriction endonuclease McrA